MTLGGAGTLTGNGSSQPVSITAGSLNITAPLTTCDATSNDCPLILQVLHLTFDDFTFQGHLVSGMEFQNEQRTKTPSGTFDPGSGLFLFTIPAGIPVVATANVDGTPSAFEAASTIDVGGSLNPVTGVLTFQFQFSGTFNGTSFNATGVATTNQVTGIGPTLSLTGPVSVNATTSCSASVTLSATASSPIGLPVTVNFAVDNTSLGSGASVTTTLPIGTHQETVTAFDSHGMEKVAIQTVTVNDLTPPVFSTVPPSVTVST